jgi:hypothetical protein
MRQIETDGSDLRIVEGELQIVSGEPCIAQSISQRLRTVRGEWRYDLSHGIPYLERILGKIDLSVVRSILREVVARSPGVRRVVNIDLTLDSTTRVLTVSGTAVGDTGATGPFGPVRIGD